MTVMASQRTYLPSVQKGVKVRCQLCLLFLLVLGWSPCLPAQELAAWVVRFDIDTPTKINELCSEAASHDFDRLLVQVRGRADAWYQSQLAPAPHDLHVDFDPLAQVLQACDQAALEAWLNVYYLWTGDTSPQADNHPAHNGQWLLHDHQGRSVQDYSSLMQNQYWLEGLYADPSSAQYRHYFCQIVEELLHSYPVTAIHLDFVRYPGPFFGTGTALAQRFQRRYGFDPRWLPEKLNRQQLAAWLDGSMAPGDELLCTARLIWDLMRAHEVSRLVEDVAKLVHQQPGFTLSAAVFPDALSALLDKGQDWPAWLAKGQLDNAFVMTYFGDEQRLQGQLAEIAAVAGDTKERVWAGLGAYIKSPTEIGREGSLCKQFGLERLGLFSLGHLRRKASGSRPYSQQSLATSASLPRQGQPDPLYRAIKEFQGLLIGNHAPKDPRLRQRLQLFNGKQQLLTQLIKELHEQPRQEPYWYERRGIFRYLHRHDSLATAEEQWQQINSIHRQLQAGASFPALSKKLSQAGSRHQGGRLPRHYCWELPTFVRQKGSFSPILVSHNGFWLEQSLDFGGGRHLPLATMAWPAKRLVLQAHLARELS